MALLTETRCDVGRLARAKRTPSGGVRVTAAVAKVGVMVYRRDDGSTVREYVPRETLDDPSALASLRDAVVTVGHPDGGTRLVSPETFRSDSVGHVSGSARMDDDHQVAEMAVQDSDAIARIDSGELVEVSPGYEARIDVTPGVADGEPYDQVQVSRSYNHLALLPEGEARGGRTVGLRLDGMNSARLDSVYAVPSAPTSRTERRRESMQETINGVRYTVGSDEWTQALRQRLDEMETAKEAAEEQATSDAASVEELTAERDALKAKLAELEAKLAELESPERTDAMVAERVLVLDGVREMCGQEFVRSRLDGKSISNVDLMREALITSQPGLSLDGKSEAYITARFDAHIDLRGDSGSVVRLDAAPPRHEIGGPRIVRNTAVSLCAGRLKGAN